MSTVLVTGGAGFVGSHLVDALLAAGHRVRVLDNLDPQAHEGGTARFVPRDAELLVGADGRCAEEVLGFRAGADRDRGLAALAEWVMSETPADRTEAAVAELVARRLIRGASGG